MRPRGAMTVAAGLTTSSLPSHRSLHPIFGIQPGQLQALRLRNPEMRKCQKCQKGVLSLLALSHFGIFGSLPHSRVDVVFGETWTTGQIFRSVLTKPAQRHKFVTGGLDNLFVIEQS